MSTLSKDSQPTTILNDRKKNENHVTIKKRAPREVDRSAGVLKTFAICGFYFASIVYSYFSVYDSKNAGLRFHKDNAIMSFLVSPKFMVMSTLGYVFSVYFGCRYMKNKEYTYEKIIRKYLQPVYNVAQIVLCSYMVWGLGANVQILSGNPFGINIPSSASIEWFMFVHYMSKFMDWTDTAFMIAKKNFDQVSFLQVFHHATIGVTWGWILHLGFGAGSASYGGFINSLTHVIMYTHYLWTSFGYVNPFKRHITNFQLTQFASCLIHCALLYGVDQEFPTSLCFLELTYQSTMLFLFGCQMAWVPAWLNGVSSKSTIKAA